MIVRPGDGVLHLIPQPNHAALAARMMATFGPLDGHPRRTSILLAAEAHDDGWREPDAAPSVDPTTGRILDFIGVPAAIKQGVWPRAIERLGRDPWAGALVAHHAVTVYDRFRDDSAWAGFFTSLGQRRDELVQRAGRPVDALRDDYVFLRLADLLSLAFCTRATEPQTCYGWTVQPSGDRLAVTPAGFAADAPFAIDAPEIPDVPYATDAALAAAIAGAPTRRLEGVIQAGRP